MGKSMTENNSKKKAKPSVVVKWGKKLMGIFEWIAEGQSAAASCKG
jgi:hypothetical protein